MHTSVSTNLCPETPTTLDGSDRPLRSLRPFWSHFLRHRGYDIRPVRTAYQQSVANRLAGRMFAWRGHIIEPDRPHLDDPNRVILAAWLFNEVVATLTLVRDSSAGLLADAFYGQELAVLRRPDRIICEVSGLAVDPDFSSRRLMSALFQTAHKYAREGFSANDAVIEIDPRHARYFQRRFGFSQIGHQRQCSPVHAPAVFMHQELRNIPVQY